LLILLYTYIAPFIRYFIKLVNFSAKVKSKQLDNSTWLKSPDTENQKIYRVVNVYLLVGQIEKLPKVCFFK